MSFDITIEDVWRKFIEQSGCCVLTGLPIKLPEDSKKNYTHTASLDRIDSNLGYISGNIQFVLKDINIIKQTYSNDRFIELCKMVASYAK